MKTFKEFMTESTNEDEKVHSNIMDHFKDKHDVKIGKPSTHTYNNHDGTRNYIVHPVTYYSKPVGRKIEFQGKPRQQYQNYVHHEVGSNDVKLGLPKRRGGDIHTVS